MQEHTTKETLKLGRSNPIHIVPTARLAGSSADALREVHMSLVRAEQNLYNLAQAGHVVPGAQFGPAGFGYATPQAFAPGFAPSTTLATPAGLAFGVTPSLSPWGSVPQSAMAPWSALTSGLTVAPGHAPSFAPGAYIGNPAWAPAINRTPACDISDEGKQFICRIDLPGVTADQVELFCFEHAVVINATREADGEVANLVQSERGTATLQRTITLPNEIQPGSAKATLSNGILTVVLPKVNPTEGPRRIKVQG